MTLLWQCASIIQSGYLLSTDAVTPLIVTWTLNAWTFVVCEAQFVQYRGLEACCTGAEATTCDDDDEDTGSKNGDGNRNCSIFLLSIVVLTIPCALGVGLFWWICHVGPEWVGVVVGGVVPTVFLGVGFLPQMYEIYQKESTEGLSIGITCLDLCGCSCALTTVIITGFDINAAVPFVVLIFFQLIMAWLILFVYPDGSTPGVVRVEQAELDCLEEGFESPWKKAGGKASSDKAVIEQICAKNSNGDAVQAIPVI